MVSPALALLALLLLLPSSALRTAPRRAPTLVSISGSFLDDAVATKSAVLKKVKAFLPLLGFYAVMLAPIYGNGIFPGSTMTDFSALRNRNIKGVVSNEYIVAPDRKFTPLARIDKESDEYPVSAERLKAIVRKVVERSPRITFIAEDPATNRLEWVQRTLFLRFPDVITFQVVPLGSDKATLAAHSKSTYGAGDLGVNRDRLLDWLAEIDAEVYKGL